MPAWRWRTGIENGRFTRDVQNAIKFARRYGLPHEKTWRAATTSKGVRRSPKRARRGAHHVDGGTSFSSAGVTVRASVRADASSSRATWTSCRAVGRGGARSTCSRCRPYFEVGRGSSKAQLEPRSVAAAGHRGPHEGVALGGAEVCSTAVVRAADLRRPGSVRAPSRVET